LEPTANTYPTLQLVVRHGSAGVKAVAALALVAGLGAAFTLSSWWLVPLVLLGAGLTYVLGQSFVELSTLIVDMMVPK
jgi:hypothetical protein